jgi:hypothetical protein
MSGYLQRMVAMALTPNGRVHPFVNPTFAAAGHQHNDPASQPFGETAWSEATPKVQTTNATASLAHRAPLDESANNGAPQPQRQEQRSEDNAARHERYQPLMPEAGGESAPGDPTVSPSTIRDAAPKHEASGQRRRNRQKDDEALQTHWKFEPLMRDTAPAPSGADSFVRPTRNGEALPNEAPGLMHATKNSKGGSGEAFGASALRSATELTSMRRLAQQQPPRMRSEQQSEEIEIHIGRIEVTAMPPAAPRPMPAPARKTQTLDEYLRRSNGRAG